MFSFGETTYYNLPEMVEQLRQEIIDLQKQITALEARVAALESK